MYESFYKLTAKPFKITPDPGFFFGSRGHKRVLAYLQYGVHQGDGFIVVTGDVGTGKTTLVRTLLAELDEQKKVIASQLSTTQLEATDLLQMIAGSYGLPYEGLSKSTVLKNLEKFFRKQAKEGKRVLLIVDEAQNLPVKSLEELRMLSNFQDGKQALFQSFLLGQVEFRTVLGADYLEQFRQRIIASYHLGPLNFDETRAYIEHRLKLVGWNDDPKITDDAFSDIYDFTSGVPRKINTLCDRALLLSCLEESHSVSSDTINLVTQELYEESFVDSNDTRKKRTVLQDITEEDTVDSCLMELEQRLSKLESRMQKVHDAIRQIVNEDKV